MNVDAVDILILSNGPGELATWVKPVVRSLRQRFGNDRTQMRLSVVLSPCTNASGQEAAIARRYPEVDRVQAAKHFWPFLLWGKTAADWDWRDRGLVLFLGGDQFFAVAIGRRLGYRTVVYAEWEARWHRWVDRFGVMQPQMLDRVAPANRHKFSVVGDLMAEVNRTDSPDSPDSPDSDCSKPAAPVIGLLPGSKPAKLFPGVPLTLAIAERIQQQRPEVRFGLAVAPTLELQDLARYADPAYNPAIARFGWGSGELVTGEVPVLKTRSGVEVELWTEVPAYDRLAACNLCLTTVGANTAELGALAVPMLVLIPTQQLDLMRAWDGIPGLLANLPGVGGAIARQISHQALKRAGRLAWPNIWAGQEIVPELVGALQPDEVAAQVLELLAAPDRLDAMSRQLRSVRGEAGAAEKLVQLVWEELYPIPST